MGGVKTPGALVEASVSVAPRVSVPVCAVPRVVPECVVSRCVHKRVETCAATHAYRECKGVCESALMCEWNSVYERDPVCNPE